MISFRDARLERVLENKAGNGESPSLVAKRDLERYRAIVGAAELELSFSTAELNAIFDSCNGTIFEPFTADPGICHNVQDALLDGLGDKWEVDGDKLVAKLRKLTPAQSWALVEKIERYWRN